MAVRVDHAALVRGHAEEGEVCDIAGIGPIPVATARALANDGVLKVVVTKGVDVVAVAHGGRTIPAHVRTALEARDPRCVIPGCDVGDRLEIDHLLAFAEGGPTTLENLARLCHRHHYLKTHQGWVLGGRPGAWTWDRPGAAPEAVSARPRLFSSAAPGLDLGPPAGATTLRLHRARRPILH